MLSSRVPYSNTPDLKAFQSLIRFVVPDGELVGCVSPVESRNTRTPKMSKAILVRVIVLLDLPLLLALLRYA